MKKNDFKISGKSLFYNGKVLITSSEVIDDYILDSDCIILLTKPGKFDNNQNVFCYDFNGQLRWKIAATDLIHSRNYYTSIYFSKNNLLQAYNVNGIEVTLDKRNGNIVKKELIK